MRAWLALCLVCGVARADDIAELRAHVRDATTPAARAAAWGELGETLWRASCPVPEHDGLCERIVPFVPVARGELPTRCGPGDRAVAVPREVRLVKAALDAFTEAANADPATAVHYGQLRHIRAIDYAVERAPAIAVPLDHDGPREREWLRAAESVALGLAHAYMRHVRADSTVVEAEERRARVFEQLATQLLAAELPADLRTGSGAPDRLDAFCDAVAEFAERELENARILYENCVARSAELLVADDSTRACARALTRIDPERYPPDDELLHLASKAPALVAPEPPAAPTSSSKR